MLFKHFVCTYFYFHFLMFVTSLGFCACDRPALYDSHLPATRKVTYQQSFGGRPINLPDVSQHSTIDPNTVKVSSATPGWENLGFVANTLDSIIQRRQDTYFKS